MGELVYGQGLSPKDLVEWAKNNGIRVVDLRFMDLPGLWQHFSITIDELDESVFTDGIGFDGSSIRGFQQIQESDMLLVPDPNTAFVDPFAKFPTLVLICKVVDPISKQRYSRDARYIAEKAEEYLKSSGIADVAYFGPEAEFYIFDDVRYEQTQNRSFHQVDSIEGFWNTAREESPNLGYKIRYKEGYFPVPPADKHQDIRSDMALTLEKIGIKVEVHHHEVGTAGQGEIDVRFDSLVRMADKLTIFKYIVKNTAYKYGKVATFMPKPIFMDNGSGMHTHQSLWKGGKNLFFDPRNYGGLSELALYYIGGILKHTPSILAFTNPTTNSYRRLVPGFEAPVNIAYSMRNRSAIVRIPMYSPNEEKSKRIEFRAPDPSCNPYLAFSAMLMAGIDGIINKIEPPEPMDKNLYDLEPEEAEKIGKTPASLEEALKSLEKDHEFLLKGDVFTEDIIETWIRYKWDNEIAEIRQRPHPYEFALYFDI
jgi:glutamine synthetase